MNPYQSDNTKMEPLNLPPAIWPAVLSLIVSSFAGWLFWKIVVRLAERGPHFRNFTEMFSVLVATALILIVGTVFACFGIARIYEVMIFVKRVR